MSQVIELSGAVPESLHGARLDQALSAMFPDYSRSRLKEWIQEGLVTVNGAAAAVPRAKVSAGDGVAIRASVAGGDRFLPEDIPLDVVYEDGDLLVVNKPAGLAVHPGAGRASGTLLNGLLRRYPASADLPRAGIVHRLDMDTSGLMVVAKNIRAVHRLVRAISRHDVVREYEAVVAGHMTAGGEVDAPIGRHPANRVMMAVVPEGMGREAVTYYRVLEKFRAHTRLRLRLETGRTHQIRVHMAYIKHPLAGDPLYGGKRARFIPKASPEFTKYLNSFPRQALHAARLEFRHPLTGEDLAFEAPLPRDMAELLEVLRRDTREHPDDVVW